VVGYQVNIVIFEQWEPKLILFMLLHKFHWCH